MTREPVAPLGSTPVISAEVVRLKARAAPITEHVVAGEVLGIAGLDGHGQEHFLQVLAGLERPSEGKVVVWAKKPEGAEINSFGEAVANGVAYLGRDRRSTGIFPALSILDNFAATSFGHDMRMGLISHAAKLARFREWQDRLEIVARDPNAPITALSGGNQQKVLLARWLALKPRILLLNDPTRGVDQRTREVLYRNFLELAANEKTALIVLSTEIEELMHLASRVIVFRAHEVSAQLGSGEITHHTVIDAMFGREDAA